MISKRAKKNSRKVAVPEFRKRSTVGVWCNCCLIAALSVGLGQFGSVIMEIIPFRIDPFAFLDIEVMQARRMLINRLSAMRRVED